MPKTAPWWVLPGLAVIMLGLFAWGIYLSTGDTRPTMLTGSLNLAFLAAGYFFGSSNGSQKKDDTIASVTNKSP